MTDITSDQRFRVLYGSDPSRTTSRPFHNPLISSEISKDGEVIQDHGIIVKTNVRYFEEMFTTHERDLRVWFGDERYERFRRILTDGKAHPESKMWRLNNLYKIEDKQGNLVTFRATLAQLKVYSQIYSHPRLMILKSRQQGISTLWLISFLDDALFNPNFRIGMISYNADQRIALLDRAKVAWECFVEDGYAEYWGIKKITNNRERELSFSNRSKLQILSKYRGGTLQRLHISELGALAKESHQKAKELFAGDTTAVHGNNQIIIETTAEGENLFAEKWRYFSNLKASGQPLDTIDFLTVFLSWLEDPACHSDIFREPTERWKEYEKELNRLGFSPVETQKNWWINRYNLIGSDIHKEFPATPDEAFMIVTDGAVYADVYTDDAYKYYTDSPLQHVDTGGTYCPGRDYYVCMDLGMVDPSFLIFFQAYQERLNVFYEVSIKNKYIEDLCDIMEDFDKRFDLSDDLKGHTSPVQRHTGTSRGSQSGYFLSGRPKPVLILPHDATQRNQVVAETRVKSFKKRGYERIIMADKESPDTIQMVRNVLRYTHINVKQCPLLHAALINFSYIYDKTTGTYNREKTLHDKHSDPADSFLYGVSKTYKMVMGQDYTKGGIQQPTSYRAVRRYT